MTPSESRLLRVLADAFVKSLDRSITAARIGPELREIRKLQDLLTQHDAYEAAAHTPSPEGYYCDFCGRGTSAVIFILKNTARLQLCFDCLKENDHVESGQTAV